MIQCMQMEGNMRALEDLNRAWGQDKGLYRVYSYVNGKGEHDGSQKHYVRLPQAQDPLRFSKDGAWAAIDALASVGISAWAEEV